MLVYVVFSESNGNTAFTEFLVYLRTLSCIDDGVPVTRLDEGGGDANHPY